MKCKCENLMKIKFERICGKRVRVLSCPKCGKELVLFKDAISLQEKLGTFDA